MKSSRKITTRAIRELKGVRPVAALTAYDAPMARLVDEQQIDLILVGDSLGNAVLGLPSTVPVTLDMMVHHCAAVSRVKPKALLVCDLPFAEAHFSFDHLLSAARRCIQEGGAEAVKLEGGAGIAPKIRGLVEAGIPVLGHIGLLPQSIHSLGKYRKFGTTEEEKERLAEDAAALEKAGVFAVIGEMIDADVAARITRSIEVPFIGIGSGPHCDGQILVMHDILGLTAGGAPAFARTFADLGAAASEAFRAYREEVVQRKFPSR